MAFDIMVWLALALAAVHVAGALLAHYALEQRFRSQLDRDINDTAACLTIELAPFIWDLDPDRIRDYLAHHPLPRDITHLIIRDQFHDILFEQAYSRQGESALYCYPIHRRSELIGTITIKASLNTVRMAQRFLTQMSFCDIVAKLCISLLVALIIVHLFVRRPFLRLGADLQRIGGGDYTHRIAPMLHKEFAELALEVNILASRIEERSGALESEVKERQRAHDRVRELADVLEVRIAQRTADLEAANKELRQSIGERKRVQRELDSLATREQARIGKLLHDSLGQQMAGISFLATSLSRKLATTSAEGHEDSARIAELAQDAMGQTRLIARGLNPVEPGEEGLQLSLARLLAETEAIFGIRCRLSSGLNAGTPAGPVASQLYLIAQEAINNAVRHAKANEINVRISFNEDDGILIVQDNGVGFAPPPANQRGMGLHTMHYRTDQIDGRLDILALERGGTSVSVKFPLGMANPDET